jgi:peroxiredoxin
MRIALLILLMVIQPAGAFNQKAGGQTAPDFSLKDLKGKRARLGDYRGKVVLVNFWATWCAPCKAEMPELVRWQNEYKDRGLQILGITFQPYRAVDVREAARRLKINYPILLDTGGVADLYEVADVLPLTVVIDRDGNIRDRIKGIMDAEEFEQKIKPLLQATRKTAG